MWWMRHLESSQNSFGLKFDDEDDELSLQNGGPTESVELYFQPEPLPEIHTTLNLWHAAHRV